MKDIYCMNVITGEIMPARAVIKDFYKTHKALESWTDLWKETEIETETEMGKLDFTKIF